MTRNIGKTDRTVRVTLGVLMIIIGFFVPGTAGIAMMAIGLVPLATGLFGNCPLYGICKINTDHI